MQHINEQCMSSKPIENRIPLPFHCQNPFSKNTIQIKSSQEQKQPWYQRKIICRIKILKGEPQICRQIIPIQFHGKFLPFFKQEANIPSIDPPGQKKQQKRYAKTCGSGNFQQHRLKQSAQYHTGADECQYPKQYPVLWHKNYRND